MSLYEFISYKDFLKKALETKGTKRGIRTKLASFLKCQTGFISQVLNGNTHFSLEHCMRIGDFLNLDSEEKHFFMLLVQKEKAGTSELKNYYAMQLKDIIKRKNEIKNRIKVLSNLNEKDYVQYYSNWYYAAIHVLVSIPDYKTKEAISKKLNLSLKTTSEILKFLVEKGLIFENLGKYSIGKARIHLYRESPMIFKHHTNWRIEAIKSLENLNAQDLHYSSVITISKSDAVKIKNILLKSLEIIEPILLPSKEEEIFSICMDFFKLGN